MARLRCYCFDQTCRTNPPRIEPDRIALPIAVGRSVGQGGVNVRADVLTIQQALNAVPTGQGGPLLQLDADGVIGPLTRAAIGRFQKQNISFVDFRIDPNGPTLGALNGVLGGPSPIRAGGSSLSLAPRGGGRVSQSAPPPAPTFTVTDEMMQGVFDNVLPISRACVKTALRTLEAAKTMGTIESPSQTLLRKHFRLQMSDPPPDDFKLIQRVFRDINREMSFTAQFPGTTFIKFPFTLSFDEMATTRVLALSLQNGVAQSGQTVKLDRKDGTSATLPADAVVLLPLFFFADIDLQIGTLIHELGHFVGKPESDPDTIDDPPGNSSSDASLAQLSDEQRPRIAEIYAQFAFEAHFARPMFRLLLKF